MYYLLLWRDGCSLRAVFASGYRKKIFEKTNGQRPTNVLFHFRGPAGGRQERCFLVQTKTWNMVVSGCLSSRHSNLPIRLHFTDPFRTSWPSSHLIFLPSLLSEAVQAAVDAASHNMHVTSSLADVGRYFFNYY